MSDSCSRLICLFGHLAPDGIGLLLAARHLGIDADLRQLLPASAARISSTSPSLDLRSSESFAVTARVGLGMQPAEGVVLQLLAHLLHAHAARKRRVDVERLLGDALAAVGFMCSSVRMLCSRSASFTSSTRMSLEMATRSLRKFSACSAFLVTRSRRRIFVSPSTSLPISGPNSWSISALSDGRVLDDIVQQRRDDGRVVELQVGEDGGDFERVGEIRDRPRHASGCRAPSWRRRRRG